MIRLSTIIYVWLKNVAVMVLRCFPVWHSFHEEGKIGHLIQVHNIISNFYNTNGLYYRDICNIRTDGLYKDSLHLIDKGNIVLVNNFIINLNQNFLTTHIHHPPDVF